MSDRERKASADILAGRLLAKADIVIGAARRGDLRAAWAYGYAERLYWEAWLSTTGGREVTRAEIVSVSRASHEIGRAA